MFYNGMLSVFYGLITKNNNMELKDLEEMFKMEQELDIPYKDRWYNKDFDKRELEAEQPVKKCSAEKCQMFPYCTSKARRRTPLGWREG